jgi:hypothetical protein
MKILCLLILIFSSSVFSKNIEIKSISELGQYVDENTLVIFDLDNTIFEATRHDCHADRFYDEVKSGTTKKDAYEKWAKSQESCPVKLVENEIRGEITKLREMGAQVMALTARGHDLMGATYKQLRGLEIEFGEKAIDYLSKDIVFAFGILFVSPFYPKGPALLEFLNWNGFSPSKIVFVDDLVENIVSLEGTLPHVEFIGLHYPLVQNSRMNN